MSESTQQRVPLHPYLVLLIAAVAPGSGHWAVGNIQRGVMFAWFMIVLGWITWRLTGPEVSPIGRLAGGLAVYAISILDAYRIARFRFSRYRAERGSGS